MHISNVLKDKLFVFSGSSKTTDAEKEILELVAEKENLGRIISSSVIDNDETHDSYKVIANGESLLVKLSLDPEYKGFQKEFSALKKVEPLNLSPKAKSTGKIKFGENIHYLVTSFEEELQSTEDYGRSIIYSNYKPVLKRILSLGEFQSEISFRDKISEIFTQTDLSSQKEFADLLDTNSDNFKILNDEILGLKEWIQNNYLDSFEDGGMVHFNLTPSTILLSSRQIKLINFQESCNANPLIELAALRFSFDYSQDFEFEVFNSFNEGKSYSWEEYLLTRKFYAGIHLLKTVFQYIKEIYLFKGLRQDKILKTFHNFCRNTSLYEHLPAFQKNKEKLAELFSSPMV